MIRKFKWYEGALAKDSYIEQLEKENVALKFKLSVTESAVNLNLKTIKELIGQIARLQEIREDYEDIIGSEWGEDSYLITKD